MSLGSVLRAGSNATVARSIQGGATEGETLALLRSKYPGESADTYDAAYARGLRSWQAAGQFNLNDAQFPLKRSDVPSSGGLPHGYRFYVSLGIYDAENDVTKGDSVALVFRSIPTMGELQERLKEYVAQNWTGLPSSPDERYKMQDPELAEFEVIAVELTT